MKLNRVERWLIKLAYPDIDFDTVKIFFCNTVKLLIMYPRREIVLEQFAYQRTYRDYDDIIHFATAWFIWDCDSNILYYKIGSFRMGHCPLRNF